MSRNLLFVTLLLLTSVAVLADTVPTAERDAGAAVRPVPIPVRATVHEPVRHGADVLDQCILGTHPSAL